VWGDSFFVAYWKDREMGVIGGVCKRGICVLAGLAVAVLGLAAPAAADNAETDTSRRMVAAGYTHSLVLKDDGTLWAWGDNYHGQLGDGTRTARKTPVKVMSDVATIAAGAYHSLAVKTDGSLWAWGYNGYGQLGDDTLTRRIAPKKILDGLVSVAAGAYHTLAVSTGGSLLSWGCNESGQLGDGTRVDKRKFEVVASSAKAVAAGGSHSLYIDTSGVLRAFGDNTYGQLGDGTWVSRLTPVAVSGGTGVVAVVAGENHSMAIKTDGQLYTWGSNSKGQLSLGASANRNVPMVVTVLGTQVRAIGAGGDSSMAVHYTNILLVWGDNYEGQLGMSVKGNSYNVAQDPFAGFKTMAIGVSHSLLVDWSGRVYAVGNNESGQLGDGTSTGQVYPVLIVHTGPLAVTSVKTPVTKLYLVAGKSKALPGVVQPRNASLKTVTWKSANTSVATVDASGMVKAGAKAAGKSTTITVTAADGKFKATCKVYVVKKSLSLKTLKVPSSSTTGVGVGQSLQIKPTWTPAKATGVVPTYESSDVGVAVIDVAGVVTGLSVGKATITVKAGSKTKKFTVTVGAVAPTKITLNKKTASVARGKKVTLNVKAWTPGDADPQTVVWKSSNKSIATVNASGVVTGKKKGKATITATTWNGKKVTCVVTVK